MFFFLTVYSDCVFYFPLGVGDEVTKIISRLSQQISNNVRELDALLHTVKSLMPRRKRLNI